MKLRLITVLILLTAILLGGFLLQMEVRAVCEQVAAPLQALEALLNSGHSPKPALAEQANALWESRLTLLSTLFSEEQLQEIGCGLSELSGILPQAGQTEALSLLHNLLYRLEELKGCDALSLRSIF